MEPYGLFMQNILIIALNTYLSILMLCIKPDLSRYTRQVPIHTHFCPVEVKWPARIAQSARNDTKTRAISYQIGVAISAFLCRFCSG